MFCNRRTVLLEDLCSGIGGHQAGGPVILNRDIRVSAGNKEHVR